MSIKSLPSNANRILSRLSAEDFALHKPHLIAVELPLRKQVETPRKVIEHVYFPESGVVSVVANGDNKRSIEVGLVGRDGMTGLAIVLGTDRTPHHSYVQLAGRGVKISADNLREAIRTSTTLHQRFLHYSAGRR